MWAPALSASRVVLLQRVPSANHPAHMPKSPDLLRHRLDELKLIVNVLALLSPARHNTVAFPSWKT